MSSESNDSDPNDGEQPSPDDLLIFDAGDRRYAIEAGAVEEVLPLGRITPLPGTGPAVRGLASHRGELVLTIDTSELLGEQSSHPGPAARLLLIRQGRQAAGLLVDGVVGILRLRPERFEIGGERPRFSTGTAVQDGATIQRLDLRAVLGELDRRLASRS